MKKHGLTFVAALALATISFPARAAKKDAAMVNTLVAEEADRMFEGANKSLASGDFRKSAEGLVAARKLALSIDDTDLLTRICLSAVSFKLGARAAGWDAAGLDRTFLAATEDELLEKAAEFAEFPGNANAAVLSCVCQIYSVRLALAQDKTAFGEYIATLTSLEKPLAKEVRYLAQLYRTKGDVYIRSGDYASARDFYQKAADMHTKNKILVEIGMDWYNVARSCSLGGRKKDAVSAIEQAIKYDRDAENTSGLGADYLAYAKILMKGSPSGEEKKKALAFAEWAAMIYEAGGFLAEAERARAFGASAL